MFEGVPEQYHQFITSSTRTPPTTLPFPPPTTGPPSSSLHHHHHHNQHHHHHPNFPSFDIPLFPSSHNNNNQPLQHQITQFLHHHSILQPPPPHQPPPPPSTHKIITNGDNKQENNNNRLESSVNPDQDLPPLPWSNDEILTLLRIRSSMENWFPEFPWEHVSRKLAEVGFKRSAEKCKEKFEEESRYFSNNINYNNNKGSTNNINNSNNHTNYRMFSELEELCHGEHHSHDQNPHDHLLLPSSVDHEQHHHPEKKMNPTDEENMQDKVVAGEDDLEDHEDVEKVDGDDEDDVNEDVDRQKGESFKVVDGNGEMGVNEISKSSRKRKIRGSSSTSSLEKKNKKKNAKFEVYFKGFCEEIVNKMMIQQEEMQNKLLEDMVKRDEEKVAIEEEWKKQEIDRVNKEFEIRRHEQEIVGDRQSTIINFLKKFTSSTSNLEGITTSDHHHHHIHLHLHNQNQDFVSNSSPQSSSSLVCLQQNPNNAHISQSPTSNNPNSISPLPIQVTLPMSPNSTSVIVSPIPLLLTSPSSLEPTTQNPNSLDTQKDPQSPKSFGVHKSDSDDHKNHDIGKRWPRDEVFALINLRCKNNGDIVNSHEQKEGPSSPPPPSSVKATPLWERISKGMLEMGYKRSSKRCKEKWENINKYFRKTKDNVNKKRSTESRTCPYFQQLSTLYGQGTLANNNNQNHPSPPTTTTTTTTSVASSTLPENTHLLDLPKTTQGGGSTDVNDEKGEKSTKVQVPAFGFEF